MIPTSRAEFSEYCLRKLGQPVIQVNVATTQVDDRIDEALHKFYERHYQAVDEVFILHDTTSPEKILDSNGDEVLDSNGNATYTTDTDVEKGYIQLDESIVGVIDVFRPRRAIGLNSTQYQVQMQNLYSLLSPQGMASGGLSHYYMAMSHLKLLERWLNPEKQFTYNSITNKLVIAGGLRDVERLYGGVVIRGFRKIYGESNSDSLPIQNIWKERWLQNYSTALIKLQWGQNLSKYQQVQLVGGVTMNGDQLRQDAETEIQKLEEELESAYELPPHFCIG